MTQKRQNLLLAAIVASVLLLGLWWFNQQGSDEPTTADVRSGLQSGTKQEALTPPAPLPTTDPLGDLPTATPVVAPATETTCACSVIVATATPEPTQAPASPTACLCSSTAVPPTAPAPASPTPSGPTLPTGKTGVIMFIGPITDSSPFSSADKARYTRTDAVILNVETFNMGQADDLIQTVLPRGTEVVVVHAQGLVVGDFSGACKVKVGDIHGLQDNISEGGFVIGTGLHVVVQETLDKLGTCP